MANLSNINNKFLVTTGGNVLIGQTGAVGSSILQVTGNSTFAGDVLVEDNLYLTDTGTVRGKIQLNASDRDDLDIKVVSLGSNIKFFTVDTERMRISSTGDVGIGTTPTVGYNLDVKRTSPGYSIVGRHATGGKVGIYSSTGDNGIGTINNYPMNFFTNNSGPQVTLTTAGNVGINTTTPDQKLQVGGNFHIYDEVGNTDASLFMTTGSSDTTTVKIASNGTSYLNGGNVGIGTTSPTQGKVDILDAGAYSAHTGHGLTINSNANNAYTSMYMGADDSIDAIYIQSAGRNTSFTSKKLLLNPNGGNVGINTTSPNSKLTVSGPATPSLANGENSIRIESHSSAAASPGVLGNGINFAQKWWSGSAGLQVTGGIYGIKNSVNGTYGGGLAFYTQPSSAADMAQRMVINTDGNVGIGVTGPTQLLQLGNTTGARSKGIGLGDVANNLRGIISCDTGTNDLILGSTTNMRFFTGSTFGTIAQLPTNETMSILSNGNVGIGTNSPASVLHIKDNSANPTQLSIQSNDYSRAEEINFLNPSTSAISGQIKYYTNPTVEYMSFSTSNNSAAAERMRITNTGNVGIGTTSPWTKLAVSGTTASNSPSIGRYTTSTTAWTTILTFTNPNNTNNMYSVLLGTSENSYSQMWRVSGSVIQQTCYYTLLGDSNHPHSKDVEFRISSSALQYKNINYSTGRVLYVFDVVQSTGTFTY